jgi:hypothetical protein
MLASTSILLVTSWEVVHLFFLYGAVTFLTFYLPFYNGHITFTETFKMSCSHAVKCAVHNSEPYHTCWSGVLAPQRSIFRQFDKFDHLWWSHLYQQSTFIESCDYILCYIWCRMYYHNDFDLTLSFQGTTFCSPTWACTKNSALPSPWHTQPIMLYETLNSFSVNGISQNTSLVSWHPCQSQLLVNAFHFDQEWERSRYMTFLVCFMQQFCATSQSSHDVLFWLISPLLKGALLLNHLFIIQGYPKTAFFQVQEHPGLFLFNF